MNSEEPREASLSDVRDPLQDSLNGSMKKSMYQAADKKIVFGARRPTEDAVRLGDMPLLIEAPFPSERTLHWHPGFADQDTKINDDAADSDDLPGDESGFHSDESEVKQEESFSVEKSGAPADFPDEIAGHTAVVVSQEVLLKVNEHVSQSLDRELGGFLLGNHYRCPNTQRDYVIIDQYSAAKFTESTEVNLAFTHEAWAQLSDELSGKFLGKLLIGWYHSHPRMDVFLSSHDMEIQTERFPEPWMVALVLEPEKHRGGFFGARDGRVKPNSPVDFFELLERNSRDSVLAWENYTAVDPATSSTPVMSATNTASLVNNSPQEILVARTQQSKKVPLKRRRRGRLLFILALAVISLATAAAGVKYRQRLKNWLPKRAAEIPAVQPPGSATQQQPEPATQQPASATQQPGPATQQPTPGVEQPAPTTEPQGSTKQLSGPAGQSKGLATKQEAAVTQPTGSAAEKAVTRNAKKSTGSDKENRAHDPAIQRTGRRDSNGKKTTQRAQP